MISKLVGRVDTSIEKLQYYQELEKKGEEARCSQFAAQEAYVCQSILLFEKYKLEETVSDVSQRIKQLLHILKHLAF